MRVTLLCPPAAVAGPVDRPRHWPLFAVSTAAALRAAGHDVSLVDAHLDPPSPADTARRVAGLEPDAVLLWASDYNRRIPMDAVTAHADALRVERAGLETILAGRHSLSEARRVAAAAPRLATLVGEPETAAVSALAGGEHGVLRPGATDARPADGAAIPELPAWDLAHPADYGMSPHQSRGAAVFPVLASRGCPYGCFYCEVRSQAAYSARPAAEVVREIQLLRSRFGARSFFLADPMFALDREKARVLLDQLRPLGVRWSAMTRTDRVDAALLQDMASAGCWSLIFGIETLNPAAQRAAHKGLDPSTVGPAIRSARAAGIEVIASAMVGLPGDDPAGVRHTVEALVRLEPDFAQFFEVRVPPEHAVQGGRLDPVPAGAWEFDGHWFVGEGFSGPDEVRALRREAYRRFYLRPRYVSRRLRAVRQRPLTELRRGMQGARIALSRAAGRS